MRSTRACARAPAVPRATPYARPRFSSGWPSARDIPNHLPLGVTAAESSIRLDEQLLAEDSKWRAVSRSADFAEPYPAEFPPDVAD